MFNIKDFKNYEDAVNYYKYLCQEKLKYLNTLNYYESLVKNHKSITDLMDYDYACVMYESYNKLIQEFNEVVLMPLRSQELFNFVVEERIKKVLPRKDYSEYVERYNKLYGSI